MAQQHRHVVDRGCGRPLCAGRLSDALAGAQSTRDAGRRRSDVWKLCDRVHDAALPLGNGEFARSGERRGPARSADRGADGVGRRAHRHAGQRLGARLRGRRLHHTRVPRCHRLEPAGGAECRLAQQVLHGRDRREFRAVQHLFARRPGFRHVALHLPVCVPVRFKLARIDVLRDGGRRRDPGRRDVAGHAHGHDPACAAGLDRGFHYGVPRGNRRSRRARCCWPCRPASR